MTEWGNIDIVSSAQPKKNTKKIVLIIVGVVLVMALATCGIGFGLHTFYQNAAEQARIEEEQEKLAALEADIELLRGAVRNYIEQEPSTSPIGIYVGSYVQDADGAYGGAGEEIASFAGFLDLTISYYTNALNTYIEEDVQFARKALSNTRIAADDKNLSGMRTLLAGREQAVDAFYQNAGEVFDQEVFEEQLARMDVPDAAREELLSISLELAAYFRGELAHVRSEENSVQNAYAAYYDFLTGNRGKWEIKNDRMYLDTQSLVDKSHELSDYVSDESHRVYILLWEIAKYAKL